MAAGTLFDVRWGSVRLYCARVETDKSRSIVVHELAEGNDHPTQDRGHSPGRRVNCELLFCEMPSEPTDAMARLLEFDAQVDGKNDYIFQHPFGDTYVAKVENWSYTLDEDGNIEAASCSFVRAGEVTRPTSANTGVSTAVGEDIVAARATELTTELDAVGVSSDVGTRAVGAQEAWSEADEVPTRQVINDVASLSDELAALIEDEQLEHDIRLFPAFCAVIQMGAAVRAAALTALSEVPRLTSIRIQTPISALALAVRLYGGAAAPDRERQIRALNDLSTPGWIQPGRSVIVPVPDPRRRAA